MSKEDVLLALETSMTDPGGYKSGEYLEEHVLIHSKKFLVTDRIALVDALREWLNGRSEPRTMLAVTIARKLALKELRSDIETLKKEISNGNIFHHFYLSEVDNTINILRRE